MAPETEPRPFFVSWGGQSERLRMLCSPASRGASYRMPGSCSRILLAWPPSSPCLAAVFSLSGRRLLLIYNTRARDSATDCLLSVMEMARRRHFVPRGLSLGRQGKARCLLLVLPMLSFLKIRAFQSSWRASWRHLWLPWANLTVGFQKVCKSARIRAEWRWKCGQTSMKTVGLYIFLAAAEHLSMKKSIFAYRLQKCGHV